MDILFGIIAIIGAVGVFISFMRASYMAIKEPNGLAPTYMITIILLCIFLTGISCGYFIGKAICMA